MLWGGAEHTIQTHEPQYRNFRSTRWQPLTVQHLHCFCKVSKYSIVPIIVISIKTVNKHCNTYNRNGQPTTSDHCQQLQNLHGEWGAAKRCRKILCVFLKRGREWGIQMGKRQEMEYRISRVQIPQPSIPAVQTQCYTGSNGELRVL